MKNEPYQSKKVNRDYLLKKERTEFERALREWLQGTNQTNYLLLVIAMLLFGIFLNLVFN